MQDESRFAPLATFSQSQQSQNYLYFLLLRADAGNALNQNSDSIGNVSADFGDYAFRGNRAERSRAFADNRRIYRLFADLAFMVSCNWHFPSG